MFQSSSATIAITTTALVVASSVGVYLYSKHSKLAKLREEVKRFENFLAKVEAIIDDHMGNVVELEAHYPEFESCFAKDSAGDASDGPEHQKKSGYYFFTSDGKKIENKWDKFDLDSALAEVDEEPEATRGKESVAKSSPVIAPKPVDKEKFKQFQNECLTVQMEEEKLFNYLDAPMPSAVADNEVLRQRRKQCVNRVNSNLERLDRMIIPK